MTDSSAPETAPETPAPPAAGDAPKRRGLDRRGWTLVVAGALALILLLICGGLIAAAAAVRGAVDRARHDRAVEAETLGDVDAACLDLEQRLNRLTPPGATNGPATRAKAIRDENVAARPFLLELDRLRSDRPDDSHVEQSWPDGWRQVIEARATYADALDRVAGGGDPAFYLTPRDEDADPVLDELIADGPAACAGALRRLGDPSL
ncbi:hypothetical protein J2S43_006216 [Catenuloplanes nepalensis]|uniref:Secreted protein n=1 Tax=Catenuloplanes nepalensis TaxID=587533 RepID=A0ABT9N1Z0_9ACTN|nr:hypothetical protein [Catenuloplanes nepalensis]MDP9797704.1 hypothetical protein [Catenuloplanes nepalensis]